MISPGSVLSHHDKLAIGFLPSHYRTMRAAVLHSDSISRVIDYCRRIMSPNMGVCVPPSAVLCPFSPLQSSASTQKLKKTIYPQKHQRTNGQLNWQACFSPKLRVSHLREDCTKSHRKKPRQNVSSKVSLKISPRKRYLIPRGYRYKEVNGNLTLRICPPDASSTFKTFPPIFWILCCSAYQLEKGTFLTV